MADEFPVFYSDRFLTHDTGTGHPENATRLVAVVDYLKASQKKRGESDSNLPAASGSQGDDLAGEENGWASHIVWREPSARSVLPDVHRVHDSEYVAALKAFAEKGGGYLDADTLASSQSYAVALLAVAAWLDGVDVVMRAAVACVCAGAATGTSCGARSPDGILSAVECGDRGSLCVDLGR